jgi:hypothetical protein
MTDSTTPQDDAAMPPASDGSVAGAGNPAAYLVEVEGIGSIMPICRNMAEVDGLRDRFGERVRGVIPLYAWREWDEIRKAGEQVSREEGYNVMEAELIAIAAEREWIPVGDRLPTDGDEVLVWLGGELATAKHIGDGHWFVPKIRVSSGRPDPTHWMPPPAPPTDAK